MGWGPKIRTFPVSSHSVRTDIPFRRRRTGSPDSYLCFPGNVHRSRQKQNLQKIIEHIKNNYTPMPEQRSQLDLLQKLNQKHLERRQKDSQLEARIQSYELAYRMQMDATDAFDTDKEPQHIKDMYGPGLYARQMMITRRLLEKGVRFVQVYHGAGQPWDNHDESERLHKGLAKECDQPIAALIKDLKQRGMLDSTAYRLGGEFGRTPTV